MNKKTTKQKRTREDTHAQDAPPEKITRKRTRLSDPKAVRPEQSTETVLSESEIKIESLFISLRWLFLLTVAGVIGINTMFRAEEFPSAIIALLLQRDAEYRIPAPRDYTKDGGSPSGKPGRSADAQSISSKRAVKCRRKRGSSTIRTPLTRSGFRAIAPRAWATKTMCEAV